MIRSGIGAYFLSLLSILLIPLDLAYSGLGVVCGAVKYSVEACFSGFVPHHILYDTELDVLDDETSPDDQEEDKNG